MKILRFIWSFLRPFGLIVVEGDSRPMTQKSRPGQGSHNSERKAKGIMSREDATEKTSDFRRRTWAGSGGRCMWRPCGARVVASRGLELEVTNRGSGTPAASELARHCEATGVSLPRKGRVHESVRGQSPVSHAASALARHCEATRVSLPRKGRVHESVQGQSPVSSGFPIKEE